MRTSLLARLLAASVLIAVCAVGATAWLAARTTTVAIQQEQGRALTDDAKIYDQLLGFAATHPEWSTVDTLVRELAASTGRRIALTTQDGTPLADTDPGKPLPAKASAVLDPLAVDRALAPGAPGDRIDPRAVGPFALPPAERDAVRRAAEAALPCVRQRAGSAELVTKPNGRTTIDTVNPLSVTGCSPLDLTKPGPAELAALNQLTGLFNDCLGRRGIGPLALRLDLSWYATRPAVAAPEEVLTGCLAAARKEQLDPFVAPPALLYLTTPSGAPATALDLSPANQARIAWVAALVLLFTVAVTVLAGLRLVRPLRALTGAAQRMKEGDAAARVRVTGRDEIARLAAAFNEMAESRARVEELRKAMVGDIAHELRTPLSNIRGWLEAAEDGVTQPDAALISFLLAESRQLQRIIDDLQDLAMADAGKLRVHPEQLRVADLLGALVAAHRAAAEAAGIQLESTVDGDPELWADPVRLRQALGNLVANAVRHTPEGGRVTVTARAEAEAVVFEVADTGSGISQEDLPQVFDRFWRAEKSRSRSSGGSGLGLAIVRQLARAHGGEVTATSEPGAGSTFTLRLPK
ncbi:HAMP domain-containing sensor histidine kinase [Crossiella sp. CA-258035]|uniref:sensor histidine kinase n=1 Tax=Crossiella sp. CA-258035 TaxID=2981138 RepID=UPI0024BBF091|nr:HAMP domain-containing sensor histidine kinase [Crossiella sp. CA-258035]WHT17339.1 HAMP domain-containing sensor histidine kinase [Crossiella sp. CA-258035]